jgi:hypothetical protein
MGLFISINFRPLPCISFVHNSFLSVIHWLEPRIFDNTTKSRIRLICTSPYELLSSPAVAENICAWGFYQIKCFPLLADGSTVGFRNVIPHSKLAGGQSPKKQEYLSKSCTIFTTLETVLSKVWVTVELLIKIKFVLSP